MTEVVKKLPESDRHYLFAIKTRLEQLYDEHPNDCRLREQISDEVSWLDERLDPPPVAETDADAPGDAKESDGGQEADEAREARTALPDQRTPTLSSGTVREAPMKHDRLAPSDTTLSAEGMREAVKHLNEAKAAKLSEVERYGWKSPSSPWQRAFGYVAGLSHAIELIGAALTAAPDPDMPDLRLCSFNYLADEMRRRGATVTPAPHGGGPRRPFRPTRTVGEDGSAKYRHKAGHQRNSSAAN